MNPTGSRHKTALGCQGIPQKSSERDDPEHPCRMPDPYLGFSDFPNPFLAALPHPSGSHPSLVAMATPIHAGKGRNLLPSWKIIHEE